MVVMYDFNKIKDETGHWRFELGGINLLVDDFTIKEEKHWIKNPVRAMAYFIIGDNMYSIANNEPKKFETIEDLYDVMKEQFITYKNCLTKFR